MDKFDHLIAARSGFKGKDLVEFNRGTSKAQAKGSLAGLVTASFAVGGAGAVRLGGTVVKALAAPTPFNPARRAMLQAAAAAPVILSSPAVNNIARTLPRAAKNLPRAAKDAVGVVMRYPGHRLGTPVGNARDTISHISKVVRGQGFEGRVGHVLSKFEDAVPILKHSYPIGPQQMRPPVPTNIIPGLRTFRGFNRFPSPTGGSMNPGMLKRWINSLNVPAKTPDVW